MDSDNAKSLAVSQLLSEIKDWTPSDTDANLVINAVVCCLLRSSGDSVTSFKGPCHKLYVCVLMAFLDATKRKLSGNSVRQYFENSGFSNPFLDLMTKKYDSHFTELWDCLSRIGWHVPEIKDVEWTLDFITKDDTGLNIGKPRYTITLPTECGSGNEDIVNFQCTAEQLQDLVWKLKEAAKSLEKFSQHS